MESKKRQLDKLLRFYSEMELNTQVIFQMVKSLDKAWKNTATAEFTKEASLKVKCMETGACFIVKNQKKRRIHLMRDSFIWIHVKVKESWPK